MQNPISSALRMLLKIQSVFGLKSNHSCTHLLLWNNSISPSLSQPLANSLASFFCQTIVALKESISSKLHSGPSPFDFDQPHAADLLSDFAPVTPAEVNRLFHSMSNKSSQLDYIPTSLLKSCADTFSLLISHLANLSFSQATFPTNFKLALISPLLKKPGLSKSDPSNFRPVSNLNTIGKILERLALARLFPHVSVSPSFSPFQSAYRKFHSTETALLKLINDIFENIDSGKFTILTALDMSAAFDTLEHATLLHRLKHTFGLSGFVISWIQSYLFSRSSFVKIDSSSSPITTILTGVPQGSVLGPLLFVLFISPIANVINPGQACTNLVSFHQYADDTQLYIGANSSSLLSQIASIESCTMRVHDWLLNNGLHLNPSKSEAITFFNPRSKPLQTLAESVESISVAGSPIKLQTSIKNLGVYLDSRLSFDKQVSETCKASYFHIRALRHIQSSLTIEAAKTVGYIGITAWLLQFSSRWHICFKPISPTARSEYPCTRCGPKVSLWSYHACSVWIALASRSSQNKFQDSCHHSHGPADHSSPPTSLHSFHAMHQCDHSALLRPCQYMFLYAKPPWQPLDRFRLSHQKFGMHCRVIFRPSQLFLLSEEPSNTIFSCLLILTVGHLVASRHLNVPRFVIRHHLLPPCW